MNERQSDILRLEHIIKYGEEVIKVAASISKEDFFEAFVYRMACVKAVEIIGEASYRLSRGLKARFPQISWHLMQGMRHILVHEYVAINLEVVWETIPKGYSVITARHQVDRKHIAGRAGQSTLK